MSDAPRPRGRPRKKPIAAPKVRARKASAPKLIEAFLFLAHLIGVTDRMCQDWARSSGARKQRITNAIADPKTDLEFICAHVALMCEERPDVFSTIDTAFAELVEEKTELAKFYTQAKVQSERKSAILNSGWTGNMISLTKN